MTEMMDEQGMTFEELTDLMADADAEQAFMDYAEMVAEAMGDCA